MCQLQETSEAFHLGARPAAWPGTPSRSLEARAPRGRVVSGDLRQLVRARTSNDFEKGQEGLWFWGDEALTCLRRLVVSKCEQSDGPAKSKTCRVERGRKVICLLEGDVYWPLSPDGSKSLLFQPSPSSSCRSKTRFSMQSVKDLNIRVPPLGPLGRIVGSR